MRIAQWLLVLGVVSVTPMLFVQPAADREDAYRANNIGVAQLEQYKYQEAADSFRSALEIDPDLALARVNLSIALYHLPDLEASLREAEAAARALPDAPQPRYMQGLIAKAENRPEDAIAHFQRVLEIDPVDVGVGINLSQVLMQQGRYAEAAAMLRKAVVWEPYNVTAAYNLAISLVRTGDREEGQKWMQRFQNLRESGQGTTFGQHYLEQGRYAYALASTGAEPGLVEPTRADAAYADETDRRLPGRSAAQDQAEDPASPFGRLIKAAGVTPEARRDLVRSLAGNMVLFDMDGDGDLDLFEVTASGQRLLVNDQGRFSDRTQASGLSAGDAESIGIGAVAGDCDNDGRPDLFVLRYGRSALYRNEGDGKFADVTAAAGIPAYPHLALAAALVDVDHDGDLDLFIAGFADLASPAGPEEAAFPDAFAGAPGMLLRNNGEAKFTDITVEAGLAGAAGRAVAVVPTDFDNRRDVDLLVARHGAPVSLFSNMRDGTFRDVADQVGLGATGRLSAVAAADVNKDGYTDFWFGRADEPGLFVMSDGIGRFETSTAPTASAAARAAHFLDYDNDGLLDLVLLTDAGPVVLRNLGNGWEDVSRLAAARLSGSGQASTRLRALASGDVDGDGDTDLVVLRAGGDLRLWINDGGSRRAALRIRLEGKVGNRSGIGAKVEARSGSLIQKTETSSTTPSVASADVHFGIGGRSRVDAIRVLWPSGIVQAETDGGPDQGRTLLAERILTVTELDRKPSSCPYLYTWDGERFTFVTDFLGAGEMGYWLAPGQWNRPDPDEYVRIREDQLRARNGRYELRVTNELEEVLYLDRLQLIAVAHPADVGVFPNEGMTDPPKPHRLYTVRNARPPAAATGHGGRDVLARLARLDRLHADGLPLLPIRGYAGEHALTLDLGDSRADGALLLLTGWTDYAFSSDNVAAHQRGLGLRPPSLQIRDAAGTWRTAIGNIGVPVGRPQTVVVDLTGKLPPQAREARIVTNMRIYWDQVLVAEPADGSGIRSRPLRLLEADLRWRGFSAETSPDGRQPFGYDYDRVSPDSPWKVPTGRYTREGDVRELLHAGDDMFVVSRPGDEVALVFDATDDLPLPQGWKRTFLLYAVGYSKEMDINSASPDQVLPLPFRRMTRYPYAPPEAYPQTQDHKEYAERYNTRRVSKQLPTLK